MSDDPHDDWKKLEREVGEDLRRAADPASDPNAWIEEIKRRFFEDAGASHRAQREARVQFEKEQELEQLRRGKLPQPTQPPRRRGVRAPSPADLLRDQYVHELLREKLPVRDMCKLLDGRTFPPLPEWNARTWSEALNLLPGRVKTWFSKIKKKAGLL